MSQDGRTLAISDASKTRVFDLYQIVDVNETTTTTTTASKALPNDLNPNENDNLLYWIQRGNSIVHVNETGRTNYTGSFTVSMDLSGDGNTIVIGVDAGLHPITIDRPGNAHVYRYDSDRAAWSQLGSTLYGARVGSDFGGVFYRGRFGKSVALSYDGNTLAVGDTEATQRDLVLDVSFDSGGGYIFDLDSQDGTNTNADAEWKMQLNISGEYFSDQLGVAVAISPNGDWAAFGAGNYFDHGEGYVRVYRRENVNSNATKNGSVERSGSTWVYAGRVDQQSERRGYFGQAVSLSENGKRLAVGSYYGYVQLFQRDSLLEHD